MGLAGALCVPATAAAATVTVANYQFTPADVTVQAGESVTWSFQDGAHNAKGSGWSVNDGFGKGSASRRFDTPGSYAYVCEAHSSMKGTVTVAAPPAQPAPAPPEGGGQAPAGSGGTAWSFPASMDFSAPAISAVRVPRARASGPRRLALRLSEDALVVVAIRRAGLARGRGRVVRVRARRGANRLRLPSFRLRPARYRLGLVAVDAAGNESRIRTATLRVPARRESPR